MKYIKNIIVVLVVLILGSCASLKVQKANDVKEVKAQHLYYTLPKASVQLTFTFTKHQYIPGPYAAYAKQFLELEEPKLKEDIWWSLDKLEHQLITSKDTSNAYVISGAIEKIKPENWTQLLNFQTINESPISFIDADSKDDKNLHFSELTLKKLIIEDSRTSYKTVTIDSITKRVPIVNTVIRNKTTEELAKDAAKSLTKIRKRKFRLMAGIDEKKPKEGALKLMLEALEQKEEQYLELFMGKIINSQEQYQVQVYPETIGDYSLFAWNKQDGLLSKGKASDKMILSIQGQALVKDTTETKLNTTKFLPFKMASNSQISVKHNNKVIYSAVVQLPQLAKIQYLPVSFLKSKSIELGPKTGILRKIQ
jgi:hypothetical protein